MFSTKNCWPKLSESFCDTRRAMTSVGPPAGNPTTTRTGRFGYPCAHDGATPDSSNTAARIPCKTGIMARSLDTYSRGAIIGEGALQDKGQAICNRDNECCLAEAAAPIRQAQNRRHGASALSPALRSFLVEQARHRL